MKLVRSNLLAASRAKPKGKPANVLKGKNKKNADPKAKGPVYTSTGK